MIHTHHEKDHQGTLDSQALKNASYSTFKHNSRMGLAFPLDVVQEIKQSLTASLAVLITIEELVTNCLQQMTAHKIAKSSSSKITVFRPDLLISFTQSSSKTNEKKCVNFPDASASTAPMPALTLEDSGSKHASVKAKNTCEMDW